MKRVEQLIARIEQSTDPQAVSASREVVQILLDVHAAGLPRIFAIGDERAPAGKRAPI